MDSERIRSVGPRWLMVAAVAVALLVAAVVPAGDAVARSGPFDILVALWLHASGYALLEMAVLVAITADPDPPLPPRATPVAVVGYGLALEGVQLGVPYRMASRTDAVANAAGVALAMTCWLVVTRLR